MQQGEVQKVGAEVIDFDKIFPARGTIKGLGISQAINPFPSLIHTAATQSGIEELHRQITPAISDRPIETKEVFQKKQKTLHNYLEKLKQYKKRDRYLECMADFDRRKYQDEFAQKSDEELIEEFFKLMEEKFDEPTERDNVLFYVIDMIKIEQSNINQQISQLKKMINYWQHPHENSIPLAKANTELVKYQGKVLALEDTIKFNEKLQKVLIKTEDKLKHTFFTEIRDGYNVIPKAMEMLAIQNHNTDDIDGVSLAVAYRDEVLKMQNPLDLFETFISKYVDESVTFKGYIESMISLLGVDMSSTNPSRSEAELQSVRNGLYFMEICGQVYDQVGQLMVDINEHEHEHVA